MHRLLATGGLAWVIIGMAGQFAFGSRFLWQWIVSERARQVIIPRGFWILSLVGGAALFLYACHKRDPVFIVGQGLGMFIYLRNLGLLNSREK